MNSDTLCSAVVDSGAIEAVVEAPDDLVAEVVEATIALTAEAEDA